MRCIRNIVGKGILFFDAMFSPKALERNPDAQKIVDEKTSKLALYQYHMCPFCVKVRRVIKKQNLKIELRDALNNQTYANELLSEGGKKQVPCLRIENNDGSVTWLYESSAINDYLENLG